VRPVCVIGEADPFVARLLQRFVEESGLEPACAQVGQQVLELAREAKPKAIILGIELPGQVRGWEAVRALKADPETCHIPVITCSWLNKAETHALVGDVEGHLRKPNLHYDDFLAALQEAGVEL